MPRGFSSVLDAKADVEARRAAGGGGGKLYFRVADGETQTVRFLEQGDDIAWAYVHELPPAQGKSWGVKVPCIDQDENGQRTGKDCPGCERNLPRRVQGAINVIWRNSPILQRDEAGKLVKDSNGKYIVAEYGDQIAVWVAGVTVFGNTLAPLDAKYKGLTSRDFEVSRQGTGTATSYNVMPADVDAGPVPLSKEDEALASEKYDLAYFTEAPSYENWGKTQNVSTPSGAGRSSSGQAPADSSPFARRRG